MIIREIKHVFRTSLSWENLANTLLKEIPGPFNINVPPPPQKKKKKKFPLQPSQISGTLKSNSCKCFTKKWPGKFFILRCKGFKCDSACLQVFTAHKEFFWLFPVFKIKLGYFRNLFWAIVTFIVFPSGAFMHFLCNEALFM